MGLRELEAMIQEPARERGVPGTRAWLEQLAERRSALFVQAAAFMERQAQLRASE